MPHRMAAPPDAAAGTAGVLRGAVRLIALVAPISAVILAVLALLTGDGSLLAWAALGVALGVVCIVEMALGRADIEGIALFTAIGVAVAGRFAPEGSVATAVSAAAMFAVVLFTFTERSRWTTLLVVTTFGVHAMTLLWLSEGWSGLAGPGLLLAGGVSTWHVLGRVVGQRRLEHVSYRQLFDRVPVGLYRTGLGGELLDVNPAVAELLGVPRDRLIGRRAQDFFVDRDDFDRLRAAIGEGSDPLTTDIRFRRPDGTLIWVRDQTRPVTDDDGTIVCFEGELQDVTEERRHLDELEALVRSKSELIGAVSHELRTPLTAVVGFLELLQSGDAGGEDSELLALAADQARDIAGIVDDLLTAARLDNQELLVHATLFDLRATVEMAITSVTGSGPRDIVVDLPSGLQVMADAARVRQVLRNLVGNAIRYGAAPIVVRADESEGTVRVVVSDRGPEIPESTASRMFDAFFSGGEASGGQPGSIGLGLAVSQRLARLMDGELSYARVGDETRFVLELPTVGQGQMRKSA